VFLAGEKRGGHHRFQKGSAAHRRSTAFDPN
jgi:hypothetical protein